MDDAPLDLPAYARRIGHAAPFAPTLEGLHAITALHPRAIPFENIDPLVGRVPRLDTASLQAKLVLGGRGGYCFEQNGLLLAVLRQCGFDVRPREARVRSGVAPDVETGRTHMALEVRLRGEHWLVDVGFGRSPSAPLRLASRDEQTDGTGRFRFVAITDESAGLSAGMAPAKPSPLCSGEALMLQARTHEGWVDSYLLLPSAPAQVDREIGNWFVATHPGSHLRRNLLVARAGDRGRTILYNRRLSLQARADEPPRVSEIDSHAALRDVLADTFGLRPSKDDLEAIVAALDRLDSAGP